MPTYHKLPDNFEAERWDGLVENLDPLRQLIRKANNISGWRVIVEGDGTKADEGAIYSRLQLTNFSGERETVRSGEWLVLDEAGHLKTATNDHIKRKFVRVDMEGS